MGLDLNLLANSMDIIYRDIVIKEKIENLNNFKDTLIIKKQTIDKYIKIIKRVSQGKLTRKLIDELNVIGTEFNTLYSNFDDKLMIFIIGNGNVGKSTLLNSLIGKKVAETNFLPTTWKIDVYTPELNKDCAFIKYINGKQKTLRIDEIKNIIDTEEKKSKESRKLFNENKNKKLKGIKIKEERDEIIKYLSEKYLYKSDVAEVRWPVDKNWILEKCMLVDTPGLNQELDKIGDIHDYYHKADGVLWLLDGQSISAANANTLFNELDEVLKNVGGIRSNIIGVVNRIDKVRSNGGDKAVEGVLREANKIFGKKFCNIVNISAMEAFSGISNNNSAEVMKSGILNLQNAIRDIFISKAESVKNNAKIQGSNKLLTRVLKDTEDYLKNTEEYKNIYIEKKIKLNELKKILIENIEEDVNDFFKAYLNGVELRVDKYINELSNGEGAEFIKDKMYKMDDFFNDKKQFEKNKILEIENSSYVWKKLCAISEYKYIDNMQKIISKRIEYKNDVNFEILNDIQYYTPVIEEGILDIFENVIGKCAFFFKKKKIKETINNNIRRECKKIKKSLNDELNNKIYKVFDSCNGILELTFKDILFDFKDIDFVVKNVNQFNKEIIKENEEIKLKEIIL